MKDKSRPVSRTTKTDLDKTQTSQKNTTNAKKESNRKELKMPTRISKFRETDSFRKETIMTPSIKNTEILTKPYLMFKPKANSPTSRNKEDSKILRTEEN